MKLPSIRHYLTARDTSDRLAKKRSLTPKAGTNQTELPAVFINPALQFQTIEGFGGAFTESAAVTLGKMSAKNQKQILSAYFDPAKGHGYSLCRTHINSCDFSLGNYAYTETPGDTKLKDFSIERDRKALLPMIKKAHAMNKKGFKLFASPWSPPAWMKTTGKMNQGGTLKPEYRAAWAQYYVRYIREYEKAGVKIWGVTVQNEPMATQTWDSCIYQAEDERDFVRDHLGPTLAKAGLGHVKIIIWDHNRDLLVYRASVAYSDPKAAKYIWGTGFHWYVNDKFENVALHHDAWPDKKLLFTEGCQEGGPHTGEWPLGERYARSMISDLNKWTVGWVDWNLLLDETGGPNHVGNMCSAPILADTKNDQVLFQSSYYYIGHFARFIKAGAKRILCATTKDALESTAFMNPDGSIAVVVLNQTELPINYILHDHQWSVTTVAPPRSISTFVIGG
jgi:glucosylceramidase